jgi:hypothetical protein
MFVAVVAALGVATTAGGCADTTDRSQHGAAGTTSSAQVPSSSSSPTSVPAPAPPAGPGGLLAGGTYTDGPVGTPHYELVVVARTDGTIGADLRFVYQDGRVGPVLSFSAPNRAGAVPAIVTAGQGTVSPVLSAGQVELTECTANLQFAHSAAACRFDGPSS